ncbi:MAG: autotransporter domain-containing protein [Hyphomonadaceae bacterium]
MSEKTEVKRARSGLFGKLLASASIAAVTAMSMTTPADALLLRDDVGAEGSVDVDNEWAGVGQMFARRLNANGTVSTFLCTGSLINPRTVVFAQHCTAGVLDEGFDPGAGSHMGFGFDPLNTFTGFDLWRRDGNLANPISNPLTGNWYSHPDDLFYNVLQVRSVFNNAEAFPGGDLTIASFDTPVIGLPTYGMLFSPLSGPTHATLTGYGTNGDGTNGPNPDPLTSIDWKRRIGENMIDGLYSQNDYVAGVFNVPGAEFTNLDGSGAVEAAQLLYHLDFDRPDRDPNDCLPRGNYFGFAGSTGSDVVCLSPPSTAPLTWDFTSAISVNDQIDWFPGDALPNEAGTAGGDSGSGLFADEIYERPLVTGVLSGGWVSGFFDPVGGYGSESYYNPLFLFRDWLVENNPYVYASARNGSRNWSNPQHWVQNMDPNYFYIDNYGRVRNGLPAGAEPGYFADAPKWGTIYGIDIPTDVEGKTDPENTPPLPPAATVAANNALGVLEDPLHGGGGGNGGSSTQGNTASVGGPTGPGSTRFVPNNSYGTYGSWDGSEDGVARFYDVTLNNVGTTTLDINVEIDNLTVSGALSALHVRNNRNLNSLVAVDQFRGFVTNDGTIATREYMLWGGVLGGRGAFDVGTLYNVGGLISPGDLLSVNSMTINGDYVQTDAGAYVVNIRRQGRNVSNDFIEVNGGAGLDGTVAIVQSNLGSTPRHGDVYTVLHADTVSGNFDHVELLLAGLFLKGESIVRGNGNVDVRIKARSIWDYFGASSPLSSLAAALDGLRFSGNSASLGAVFDRVDTASAESIAATMYSLTPQNAFTMTPMAVQMQQGMTLDLSARTAELRAGQVGISQRSMLSGMSIAQAGANGAALTTGGARPIDMGERLGFFVTGHGNLTAIGEEAYEGDRYNPGQLSAFSTAEMTVGADYRLSENTAIGIATTFSRFLNRDGDAGVTPMDHTGYGAMLYATTWDGNWFVDGHVGVARHEYHMMRAPGFNFSDGLDSAPGATQAMAGVRGGWMFEPIENLNIGPTLSLNYSSLNMDGYQEAGVAELALDVSGRTMNSVTVETALAFDYTPASAASRFSAYGHLGFVTELGDGVDLVTARFLAAPDAPFNITRGMERDWVSSSLGMSYRFDNGMAANLEASSDMGREYLDNTSVRAGFSWDF